MKLRFKIMIMVFTLPLIVFVASLTLHINYIFTLGPQTKVMAEELSEKLYDETTIIELRNFRFYYGRYLRPLVNSLYSIQPLLNQTLKSSAQYDSSTQVLKNWIFNNITELSQLRQYYPEQFTQLLQISTLNTVILSMLNAESFTHLGVICMNGLIVHYGDKSNMTDSCTSHDDCVEYVNKYSELVLFPMFRPDYETWGLRIGDCVIEAQKPRKYRYTYGATSNSIRVGLLNQGSCFSISGDDMPKLSNISDVLQVYENQTESIIDAIYNITDIIMDVRQFKYIYQGIDEERIVLIDSYWFINSVTISQLSLDERRDAQIIYLTSMTLKHYNQLSGEYQYQVSYDTNRLLIMIAIFLVLLMYVWRKSVVIALSFEMPIREVIRLMNVEMKYLESQEFNAQQYQQYFNSREVKKLYKIVINYINNIKYSNNKMIFGQVNETDSLIVLCMSKQFYKNYGNQAAVGICSNNISKIHTQNKRYLEAMNEQEESVLIAYQDLQSLQEVEKIAKTALNQDNNEQLLYQLYLRLKSKVLQRFQREDEPIIQNIHQQGRSIRQAQYTQVRKPTVQRQNIQTPGDFSKIASDRDFNVQPFRQWIRNGIQEQSEAISEPRESSPRKLSSENSNGHRQSYKMRKLLIRYKIVYRKYQLASVLFNYSVKNSQSAFLNESVELFNEILDESNELPKSGSIMYMRINLLTKKAFCYARANLIEESRLVLADALQLYREMTLSTDLSKLNSDAFVDIFHDIPTKILQEKIQNVEALLLMIQGEYSDSAIKFVNILKQQGHYDPALHKFILQTLYRIFTQCNLNTQCLLDYQKSSQPKQVQLLLLIDYSSEMTAEQYTLAHSMCKYVIQELRDDNMVGLYAFNESLHEIFGLQQKGIYHGLIDQSIKQLLIYPGGQGNIFNALEIAIAYLFDLQKVPMAKQISQCILDHNMRETFQQAEMVHFSLPDFKSSVISPTRLFNKSAGLTGQPNGRFMPSMNSFQVDLEEIEQESDDQTIKFICIMSEGVHQYSQTALQRIKSLVSRKNVHLLVFNIANQNMNMLYLKQLAQVSPQSRFFTSENEMMEFFRTLQESKCTKRSYLEFF